MRCRMESTKAEVGDCIGLFADRGYRDFTCSTTLMSSPEVYDTGLAGQ